nr:MAG TPA: hypothetical protein [Caudoviricetes sp.]
MLVMDVNHSSHAYQPKKCANAKIIIRESGVSLV